jgi:hypothetical protein
VTNINIRSLVSFWLFDLWHLAHLRPRLAWLTESAARRQTPAIPTLLAALLLLLPLPGAFQYCNARMGILLLASGLL